MFLSNLAQGRCREPVPSSFLPPFRARALPSRMPSLPNRRASWKGQKPPLPRNFGTRPLHPNIIWHSIKGKGERIRREEEARRGLAWPQLCLALSLFLSLRGVLHGAWCQLLFGAVVGPVVGLSVCLRANKAAAVDGALGDGTRLSHASLALIQMCAPITHSFPSDPTSAPFGIETGFDRWSLLFG